jgi:hypothetical protein
MTSMHIGRCLMASLAGPVLPAEPAVRGIARRRDRLAREGVAR